MRLSVPIIGYEGHVRIDLEVLRDEPQTFRPIEPQISPNHEPARAAIVNDLASQPFLSSGGLWCCEKPICSNFLTSSSKGPDIQGQKISVRVGSLKENGK